MNHATNEDDRDEGVDDGDEAADDGDAGSPPGAGVPAAPSLTGKARRHLRALGHHLQPVVQVGKHGVTESVVASVAAALLQHELVKVKRGSECPVVRSEVARAIASALSAAVAQELGNTILFYKRHPKKPVIVLPK